MSQLTRLKCVPCEGGVKPLKGRELQNLMSQVPGWQLSHDKRRISKDFKFKNFKTALGFTNQIGRLAESEGHHPDIFIHDWNSVKIGLITHAIEGLSSNDFIMAAKIDADTMNARRI